MKVVFCVFLLFALSQGEKRNFRGDSVYRLTPTTIEEVTQLNNLIEDLELDSWKEPRRLGDTADVRVPFFRKSQFNVFLATSGIEHRIYIEDVQKLIDEQHRPRENVDTLNFDYEMYHNFEEIQDQIDAIGSAHTDLVTVHEVGTSYENRLFKALSVTTSTNNPPRFVMNCGIHAREWITPATCMWMAQQLVDEYRQGSNTEILDLLNQVEFVFIPVSNPDGYAFTWSDDRMWRKTRRPNYGSFCRGVDPNRNWDANHCQAGSSNNTCSSTYCGPEPFSENCTMAQKNFVEGLGNVVMYADIHSYSQMWMFPYGYKYEHSASHDKLQAIADASVEAIFNKHGKVYEPGTTAEVIYIASGITADYFYDVANIPCAFATELRDTGEHGFLLPENQILETAEETFEAIKVMGRAIIKGDCNSK